MEKLNEKSKKRIVRDDRIGLFVGGCTKPRITFIRQFVEREKSRALIILDAVVTRGNFGRMTNVAGEYHVTELEIGQ